jgi:thiol-disulfide isomerase/thioredoxin
MKQKKGFPGLLWLFGRDKGLPPHLAYLEQERPAGFWGFVREHRFAVIIVVVALVILLADVLSFGQGVAVRPLAKGELLPGLKLGRVLNNGPGSVDLGDYRDRLLILDFWSTMCGTCIEEMPGVAALQQRYPDQIKVIAIDFEAAARVEAFYGRRPELKALGIPVVVGDTLLKRLFPHRFEPHVVWIDHGRFVAATSGEQLTAKTVDSVLAHRVSGLRDKVDLAEWDQRHPAFNLSMAGPLRSLAPVYGSVFTGFVRGLLPRTGMVRDSVSGGDRWYFMNQDLASLYAYALQSPLPRVANRRLLLLKDSSIYLNNGAELAADWDEKHGYTFEVTVPAGTGRERVMAQLLLALRNNLGLEGRLEERVVDCLVLRKIAGPDMKSVVRSGQATDLRSLAFLLNKIPGSPPVVDECGKVADFNIALPADAASLKAWQTHLKSYGLRLVKGRRRLAFFVLEQADSSFKPNLNPIL